jgi:MCM AAA-lid domain
VCNRYIAYARQYCAPRLGDQAKALLQEHYLKLRQQSAMLDSTPVTVSVSTPADWCRSACHYGLLQSCVCQTHQWQTAHLHVSSPVVLIRKADRKC